MVDYNIPKPPQSLLTRMRNGVRLATAFVKGDRATIADITAQTVFSPLQPIRTAIPQIVGRAWDFAPGINVQYLPRGYGSGRIPFMTLRQFSRSCELLRLGIETVKDQIGSYGWQIVPKEGSKAKPDDPRIKEITAFLKKPDKINNFDLWMRTIVEEYVVTDSVSIYRQKDRVGRPYAFEIMDGATIKPLIDADGRRPVAPDPAFQQIIKGAPRAMYDTTELLYMPRNVLAYDPSYGLSIVEQIIITAQMQIERAKLQLAYFTEGSVPDVYATLPTDPQKGGMTVDQIKEFETRFNDLMSGNASGRRQVPFFPDGAVIGSMKQPPLKDEFDEWISRIICYALGLSPTWAIRQMNRSTSETDQEREEEQGQSPKLQYLAMIMNELLADFGEDFVADFEFKWKDSNSIDPDIQSQIDDRNLKNASKTLNQIRIARGDDPIEGGDIPMVLTPSGYVPLVYVEQPTIFDAHGPDPTDDSITSDVSGKEKVQDSALNGAQMAALQEICQSVADGRLPADTAINLIMLSIPSIDRTEAELLINPVKDFEPKTPVEQQQNKEDNTEENKDQAEKAYGRIRKAVRLKPLPFAGHSCSCHREH